MTNVTTVRYFFYVLTFVAWGAVGVGSVHAQTTGNEWAVDVTEGYIEAVGVEGPGAEFTVEIWVNPAFVSFGPRKIIGITDEGPDAGFVIGKDGEGAVTFEVWDENNNYYPLTGGTLAQGEWAHIALTYDEADETLTGYLNGEQTAQRTDVPSVSNPNDTLTMGVDPWSQDSEYFDGQFDEVRIWNIERSQSEIQNTMNTPLGGDESGLTHYYSLEEGSGSTAYDVTGDVDGTFMGDASWVDNNVAPLPVEVAGFEAVPSDGEVVLTWRTLSETNNSQFRIERKATEQHAWTQVGSRTSKAQGGTTTDPLRYSFTDDAIPFEAETLSYRLVQKDLDGTESTVGERTVTIGGPERFTVHGNTPNPVRGQTRIRYEVPAQTHVTVSVHDMLGRKVRTLVDQKQKGYQEVSFTPERLSSGVYLYRVTAGDQSETRRMVLMR